MDTHSFNQDGRMVKPKEGTVPFFGQDPNCETCKTIGYKIPVHKECPECLRKLQDACTHDFMCINTFESDRATTGMIHHVLMCRFCRKLDRIRYGVKWATNKEN